MSAKLKKSTVKQAFRNAGYFSLLLAASRAMGGDVITGNAPAPVFNTPAMQDDLADSQMQVFIPSGAENTAVLTDPFRYDNIIARPHFDYQLRYGNGVQSTPGSQQSGFIHEFTPGLRVDLGRYWSANFSPTMRFYSNSNLKDEYDYTASLIGGTSYNDWTFGLAQNFTSSSSPLTETGSQTDQTEYETTLTAAYDFNDKMSTDLQVDQTLNYVTNPYNGSTNSASSTGTQGTKEWSSMDWLNYTFWARLNTGIGAGAGYIVSDSGVNQIFEQVQARARWRATDKISFLVSGGFEDLQYTQAGYGDVIDPIFNASVQYQPFKDTQISLTASSTVSSSTYYILSQNTENTSLNLDWNQRLLKKFTLDVVLSYAEEDYTTALKTKQVQFSINRADASYSLNAHLSHPFMRRGTWGLTYQVTDNQSNIQGFGYTSTLFGLDLSYTY